MDMLAVILLILGLWALAVWNKHLREARQMQIRDIMHKERITAMEKGIPFKDLNHGGMAGELSQVNGSRSMLEHDMNRNVIWIRLSALCLGILFLFGGIAVAAGFPMVGDAEIQAMWPMGLIPGLIGLGLLLFFGLSRGYENRLK
jgi:hypothetical protein